MLWMRRGYSQAIAVVAGAVLATSAGAAQAGVSRASSGATWHKAIEVPGTAAPVAADVTSVSCSSPRNCAAGGYYVDRLGHQQPLVVTERAGRWQRATGVPGMGMLNSAGNGFVTSVSCASPGNCAANGSYTSRTRNKSGMFVVSEVAGKWGRALGMPGENPDFLSTDSISCPSPGDCATGGSFRVGSSVQAFVLDQTNGHWGKPLRLSGAGLKSAFYAQVNTMSCSSAGNCTASGDASLSSADELFAVNEQAGHWQKAVAIPLASSVTDVATINSMACASPGNCAAAGSYEYSIRHITNEQPLVVSETGGHWNQAQNVPGLTRPLKGGVARAESVACAAPDTCTVGGFTPHGRAFVVSEAGGTWGQKMIISSAALGTKILLITSVSCTSPGNCAAGGYDYNSSGQGAFVVNETGGKWGQAQHIPGLAALDTGRHAQVNSMSCPSAGHCTAVGKYAQNAKHYRPFVVSES
jgi:hypothetical protein